ncbi:hypothetical protein LEMLEM_LOCUS18209, partial [Lemmus lemmus]
MRRKGEDPNDFLSDLYLLLLSHQRFPERVGKPLKEIDGKALLLLKSELMMKYMG